MNNISMCRTCESLHNLCPIYHTESNIPLKMMACANIQVSEADALSKMICSACINILDIAYHFKLQCETIDSKFREHVIKEEFLADEYEIVILDRNALLTQNSIVDQNTSSSDKDIETKFVHQENVPRIDIDNTRSEYKCKLNTKANHSNFLTKEQSIKPKIYSCSTCDIIINTYSELIEHRKIHKEQKYYCQICNKYCRDNSKLNKHLDIHKDVDDRELYECSLCVKTYTSKGNLERHFRSHTGDKRHPCDICGARFIQSSTLKEHALKHKLENDHPCKDCGKAYKSKKYLLKHRENIHKDVNGESYFCIICNKRFINERKLKWHMKTVIHNAPKKRKTPENPNNKLESSECNIEVCSYCGKTFKTVGQLNLHTRIHTGYKPYACVICKKTFSFISSFKYHMHGHAGVLPYKCPVCSRAFRQPTHLKNHLSTHTGVKAFTCNFCNKSFALNSNLRIHIRIHTGERPYVCSVCKRGFVNSNGLKKHAKRHVLKETCVLKKKQII